MSLINKYIDLSKVDFLTGENTKQNTANCYIIKKPGKYKFPIVYGNSIKNGEDNKNSYKTYYRDRYKSIKCPFIFKDLGIDDDNSILSLKILWHNTEVIVSDLKFDFMKEYIKFKIKVKKEQLGGNVIIGLTINNKLIWSWHIWYYPYHIEPYNIGFYNRKKVIPKKYRDLITILPVPLGFCGPEYDGDMSSVCFYSPGGMTPINSAFKSKGNDDDNNSIPISSGWVRKEEANTILSKKSITDPCPPGWKVPGKTIFIELKKKIYENLRNSNPQNPSLITNCFFKNDPNSTKLRCVCLCSYFSEYTNLARLIELEYDPDGKYTILYMNLVGGGWRNYMIIPSRE